MKTIAMRRPGLLHVETPNGIVNIRVGLSDAMGRNVDAVEVIPNRYAGEPKIMLRGTRLVRCKRAKFRAQ